MEAIAVENLTKQYHNGVQALNGLSLTVEEGENLFPFWDRMDRANQL